MIIVYDSYVKQAGRNSTWHLGEHVVYKLNKLYHLEDLLQKSKKYRRRGNYLYLMIEADWMDIL